MPHCVVVLLIAAALAGVALGSSAKDFLDQGNALLKTGDFSGALDKYHAAVDADPKSYEAHFKRATVYLATGRSRQALRDLTTVLALKPSFDLARSRRAELLLKEGSLDEARADLMLLPDTPARADSLHNIEIAAAHLRNAQASFAAGNWPQALEAYTQAVEIVPSDASLRLNRAKCYMNVGQVGEAIGDVMRASKLRGNDPSVHHFLSQLHFATGARAEALSAARECVKLDGDHKGCKDAYQKLKKFTKVYDKIEELRNANHFHEIADQLVKARALDNETPFFVTEYAMLECEAAAKLGRGPEAVAACTAVLTRDARRVDALLHRATGKELGEDFEGAIADLREAGKIEENSQRINERIQRAERLLKQSQKRDYYKILGVARTASKKEIAKAYRDAAQQWHPDRFQTEEEKATAEKKFLDIAAAKEVLTDPEMRQKFDNGEDPLDNDQRQQQQQQHPFHHFFHQQHHQQHQQHHQQHHGGGGFHFKFQ